MVVTTRLSSLVAALALLRFSVAENSTTNYNPCNRLRTWSYGFNATGSIDVPGPRPNDSYPETTWTWSRYVEDAIDYPANSSLTWQTLGLKTSPLLNLSDPSTPYTGCVIAVTQLNSSLVKSTNKDDGTCSTIFGADCLAEIKDTITNAASSYSGTAAGSRDGFDCNQLLSRVSQNSSSCEPGLFNGYIGTQFLPNNFTGSPYPVCPKPNPGDSNSTDGNRAFFSFSSSIEDQTPDNFTLYDQVVTSHMPVFVATWLKSASNSSSNGEILTPGAWADTQIMCIPANETQPGSRNITEAEKTQKSAAGKHNVRVGMFIAVGMSVFWVVFV